MTSFFVKPYPPFLVLDKFDGQNWALGGTLFSVRRDGTILACPQLATTDGPSLPSWARSLISPFGAGIFGPAVRHDSCYRRTMLVWVSANKHFAVANYNEQESNDLMAEGMEDEGLSAIERGTVFETLKLFGYKAWEDNLSLPIPHMIFPTDIPESLKDLAV